MASFCLSKAQYSSLEAAFQTGKKLLWTLLPVLLLTASPAAAQDQLSDPDYGWVEIKLNDLENDPYVSSEEECKSVFGDLGWYCDRFRELDRGKGLIPSYWAQYGRIYYRFLDLTGDGIPELLTRLGRGYCGSGGCTNHIILGGKESGDSYLSFSSHRNPFVRRIDQVPFIKFGSDGNCISINQRWTKWSLAQPGHPQDCVQS